MHYTHVGFGEREQLGLLFARGYSIRQAAKVLKRHHGSIIRELAKLKTYPQGYSAINAQWYAYAKQHTVRRERKLDNERLRRCVLAKLKLRWSPEQIVHFLKRR